MRHGIVSSTWPLSEPASPSVGGSLYPTGIGCRLLNRRPVRAQRETRPSRGSARLPPALLSSSTLRRPRTSARAPRPPQPAQHWMLLARAPRPMQGTRAPACGTLMRRERRGRRGLRLLFTAPHKTRADGDAQRRRDWYPGFTAHAHRARHFGPPRRARRACQWKVRGLALLTAWRNSLAVDVLERAALPCRAKRHCRWARMVCRHLWLRWRQAYRPHCLWL